MTVCVWISSTHVKVVCCSGHLYPQHFRDRQIQEASCVETVSFWVHHAIQCSQNIRWKSEWGRYYSINFTPPRRQMHLHAHHTHRHKLKCNMFTYTPPACPFIDFQDLRGLWARAILMSPELLGPVRVRLCFRLLWVKHPGLFGDAGVGKQFISSKANMQTRPDCVSLLYFHPQASASGNTSDNIHFPG